MTAEVLLILVIRVVGSLPVLRWALVGALLAIAIDLSDLFIRELVDLGGVPRYQEFDKRADLVYLLTFFIVTTRWERVPRTIAGALLGFRLIGVALFELTDDRAVLFFFPNVFEFWFLFVASLPHWRPNFAFTRRATTAALLSLLALKLLHEYSLHVGRWFDGFTAMEAVEAIFGWVTGPLR